MMSVMDARGSEGPGGKGVATSSTTSAEGKLQRTIDLRIVMTVIVS